MAVTHNSTSPLRILHIEDNTGDLALVRALLEERWPGCLVTVAQSTEEVRRALGKQPFDIVLSDFSMPHFDGGRAMQIVHEHEPLLPFIFVSGTIGEDHAVQALKEGATDYILKDRLGRLVPAIERALDDVRTRLRHAESERQAAQRIREQAELLNKAHDAIMVSDLENRVVYWNRGAERLLGWTAAETFGQPLSRFVTAPEWPAGGDGGDDWRGEVSVRHKDGRPLTLETHTTLIRDDGGQPTARLSIGSDVTEKVQLREQFFRAQRLESIGMLAAGIAHDLNNVLAPILMAPAMLRMRATDPGDLKMLEILEKSAERGSALVKQILGFANGVGGERRPLQVKHVLRDLAAFVEQTFPKTIKLETKIPGDLWPVVASATQIHQVLLNLCVNARDAMPGGGGLRLTAQNVSVAPTATTSEQRRPGTWILIEVADTGTGMPPEVLARIWDPFFTTKAPDKGTGLGLSTVRGIVEGHGGFVNVQTAPGHGTQFQVYLPATPSDGDTRSPLRPTATPQGSGELIFVVDDEPPIRDVITRVLTAHGYRVLAAADGVEAVAAVAGRSEQIRVVIIDQHLPGMDGTVLASIFRRLNPKLRLLGVSGHAVDEKAFQENKAPLDAFLAKPFTVEALARAVHDLLAREGP